ncbi:hypothetical protein ACNAW0_26075 [Micromonospora sp. SL1-18]|uniref:hypothetical protein n=1 Tax=Micromonospora sp. SL1-18 TaxID=3399128 RepID=UPI003A4DABA1
MLTGDATGLLDLVPASAVGRVGLVLTSPPYGRGTHGLMRATSTGVRKRDHQYGDRERGNLAYAGWSRLFDGFAAILAASYRLLRPGGTVVITCRPVRRQRDDLIDLPGALLAVARLVGWSRCSGARRCRQPCVTGRLCTGPTCSGAWAGPMPGGRRRAA